MTRYALFLGALWFAVALVLIVSACSRYLFDPERAEMTLKELFAYRVFAALGWWFMWLSPRGRRTLIWLLKGE